MQHLILTDAKTKTAFHYCGQTTLLQHVLDCRHPNLGSHCVSTPNPSWESIVTNSRSQGCPRFQSGEELANSVGEINA